MSKPSQKLCELVELEAEWFFGELGGKVPEGGDAATADGARRIDGWLRQLPVFHRGVLSLHFTRRSWPDWLIEEFDEGTSVAVRLDCAEHPTIGTRDAVEAAAVERLRILVETSGQKGTRAFGHDLRPKAAEAALARLAFRAHRRLRLAMRALARVRDVGPCVVPGQEAP